MPALPSPGKVIRVDFQQTVGVDLRVRDRLFFSYTGAGPSAADMTTFLTTIASAWSADVRPLQLSSMVLTGVLGTDLASATGVQVLNPTSVAGNRGGIALGAGTCLIIRHKILRRYRGGHPRFYLAAGNTSDLLNQNSWSSTFASTAATDWSAFIAACIAAPPASIGTAAHVNVSYFSGFHNVTFPSGRSRAVPTLRGTPVVDAVQSYSINLQLGSQRRRNLQSA